MGIGVLRAWICASAVLAVVLPASRCWGQEDIQLGKTPTNSEVEQGAAKTCTVFHNVLLRETGLLFFVPDGLNDSQPDSAHQVPDVQRMLRSQFWGKAEDMQVEIVHPHNRSAYPDTCKGWIEQPTLFYSGMDVDAVNTYHFFMDNFLRMFTTVTRLGFFDLDKFFSRLGLPSSAEANLIVLQKQGHWTSKFHELWDHVTPDQWTYPHGVGYCYRTLAVGADGTGMTYVKARNQADQEEKTELLAGFRRFAIAAQLRNDALRGRNVPAEPLAPEGRIQIGLVSRPGTRSFVNEAELLTGLRSHVADKADVVLQHFNGTLTQSMLAANRSDILIGMHGAGLTNVMWMQPGCVVIQMYPYGLETGPGEFHLGNLMEQLTHNMNCSMLFWGNQRPENAYFADQQHPHETPQPGEMHPVEQQARARQQWDERGMLKYQWLNQRTHVDLDSFLPVVDEAISIFQHVQAQPE